MPISSLDTLSARAASVEDLEIVDLSVGAPSTISLSSSSQTDDQISLTSQITAASLISVASTAFPQPPDLFLVLGKETLKEIWKDNSDISLPSWIGRVPSQIGHAKVGKLSADQYRTACTVNLVITLVHLWTKDERPH